MRTAVHSTSVETYVRLTIKVQVNLKSATLCAAMLCGCYALLELSGSNKYLIVCVLNPHQFPFLILLIQIQKQSTKTV